MNVIPIYIQLDTQLPKFFWYYSEVGHPGTPPHVRRGGDPQPEGARLALGHVVHEAEQTGGPPQEE